MIRNRVLLKGFAVFFLLEVIFNAVTPAVSWALTSGPTAPEATSFEPVDTTDIVDLKTGDFVYNIPLLEIPGPAGNYPLSLSYHAGIMPNQDASWTGLGFNLNAGSISRLVNGYPDDHNAVTNVDRSYWKGGNTESYAVGVSVGVANVASVTAGLVFAQDTYRGRGVGGSVGVGFSNTFDFSIGISPYGGGYSSMGINAGVGKAAKSGAKASAGFGVTMNSETGINAGASVGVGVKRLSLLGASISSAASGLQFSALGGSAGIYNGKANNVSINSDNFEIEIPVYYSVSIRLGRNYQRYWVDETAFAHTFGSIYAGKAQPNSLAAFDTYDLLDINLDVSEFDDVEKVLGGSFPDVDNYTVSAQGLSGSIRPYHYQQHLYRQEKKDESNNYITKGFPLSSLPNNKPVQFRFVHDFSNRLEYNAGSFSIVDNKLTFDFDDNIITGEKGNDGFNEDSNHLAGSKHIEWYTNDEILSSEPLTKGFIDCKVDGFIRERGSGIGGYSITNASGVTYHYALPVYSFDEYTKTVNSSTRQDTDGERWTELKKPARYAYTWYLTAVTGPDFVDRNGNGLADKGDWGYWVNFEYKKYLQSPLEYKWRNPGEGFNRDLDGEFESFSFGRKELYYLDKVITESHVALFEKSTRWDGRESMNQVEGGFDPVEATPGVYLSARPTLKLDRIKLYDYESYVSGHLGNDYIIRQIEFGYDYSLAPGTPNSYNPENFETKTGKLTLKSLRFLGKKGISLIPPMTFGYKNMPYKKDFVDVWGFYKDDYSSTYRDETNEIIGRATTPTSALNVDAWSLNEIETPIGSKIKVAYESDEYDDIVLTKQQILRTKDIIDNGQNSLKVTFWERSDGFHLSDVFKIGNVADIDLIGSFNIQNAGVSCDCENFTAQFNGYQPRLFSDRVLVDEVNDNEGYIVVSNASFYDLLKNQTKVFSRDYYNQSDCDAPFVRCEFRYSSLRAWPRYFVAGVISMPNKQSRFGGGVRVSSISVINVIGDSRVTTYTYQGGTTSYEPYEILEPKILPEYKALVDPKETKKFYKRSIMKRLYKQMGISRVLPGPGVIYKSVRVQDKNITADNVEHVSPNYTVYNFETYQEGMVDIWHDEDVSKIPGNGTTEHDNVEYNDSYHNKLTVKDYSSRLGNLKSITLYNSITDEPISKTTNQFLHDGLDGSFESNRTIYENSLKEAYNNQGTVQQTFTRARIVLYKKFDRKPYLLDNDTQPVYLEDRRELLATISKLETFPSVPIGQENINYKTGIISSTKNLAFDFYSGDITEVLTADSYGNRYKSVTVPAYKNYPGMGVKIINKANKNMLSQSSEQYSFIVGSDEIPTGVISASIQTWSDQIPVLNIDDKQSGIWRAHASYQWRGAKPLNGNGAYDFGDIDSHKFNWINTSVNNYWEKTSELTLYDVYSHGLEAVDINKSYAASRMNEDQQKVIVSATNAKYNEIAFAGAEYYAGNSRNEGGVNRGEGNPSKARAHTGQYSLLVATNKRGFNYSLIHGKADLTRKYRASVWVYAPGDAETQANLDNLQLYYIVNGKEIASVHPVLQKNKSKSWYLLNLDIIPDGVNAVTIGVRNNTQRGVYFDDFRVHPLDASLTSFVYDAFSGELNYILDNNNFYTRFEYDAMGRLIRTSKELLNYDFGNGKESAREDAVLKTVKYNYRKGQ